MAGGAAPIMGCAASTSTRISTSLSSDTMGASTGTSRRVIVRGEPEYGFEREVPVEAPIASQAKLVEIRVDVLAAQPMIGAEPPAFHQREDSMNPGQHDMTGHLADRPRVVSVIGEPGI